MVPRRSPADRTHSIPMRRGVLRARARACARGRSSAPPGDPLWGPSPGARRRAAAAPCRAHHGPRLPLWALSWAWRRATPSTPSRVVSRKRRCESRRQTLVRAAAAAARAGTVAAPTRRFRPLHRRTCEAPHRGHARAWRRAHSRAAPATRRRRLRRAAPPEVCPESAAAEGRAAPQADQSGPPSRDRAAARRSLPM